MQKWFLGWSRPWVTAISEHLVENFPKLDYSAIWLCTSSASLGRQILLHLARAAQNSGNQAWKPPGLMTLGTLSERLIASETPQAGEWQQRAAWARALLQIDPETLKTLFPTPPQRFSDAFEAAEFLLASYRELAAEGWTFDRVLDRDDLAGKLGNLQRWQVAAELQGLYLQQLQELGLADPYQLRLSAAGSRERWPARLILAGLPQIPGYLRRMLEPLSDRIDILVLGAPESRGEELFDEWGTVRSAAWAQRTLPLADAHVHMATDPMDQAREVFRILASQNPPPRLEDLAIGLADESLAGFIESAAARYSPHAVRHGAGSELSSTRPWMVLKALHTFFSTRSFGDYVAVARLILRRATSLVPAEGELWTLSGQWLSQMDKVAAEALPGRMEKAWCQPNPWRGATDKEALAQLFTRIDSLLPDPQQRRGMAEQSAEVLKVLELLFGHGTSWNLDVPAERQVVLACQKLQEHLDAIAGLGWPDLQISLLETLGLLLERSGAEKLPLEETSPEIQMLGWLELPGQDARTLIIAGMNEGLVPAALEPGPLMNSQVRRALALPDSASRLARDAYLLESLLRNRPAGSVHLIAGRVSAQGDPLFPSRLLFATEPPRIVARVLDYVQPRDSELELTRRGATPAEKTAFGTPVFPEDLQARCRELLENRGMSVTGFADYLRSPLGFYLKHLQKCRGVELPVVAELNTRDLGTLVHAVLRDFVSAPENRHRSEATAQARLREMLMSAVDQRFGGELPPIFLLQLQLLLGRLDAFAAFQVQRWGENWTCLHSEIDINTWIQVDDLQVPLQGRIDRIDYHPELGWQILDYKLCAGDKNPRSAHRRSGRWFDLQLPLYRHLLPVDTGDKPVSQGYIRISEAPEIEPLILWDLTDEELDSAWQTAEEVIRRIAAGDFDDPGESPPVEGGYHYIFQGLPGGDE